MRAVKCTLTSGEVYLRTDGGGRRRGEDGDVDADEDVSRGKITARVGRDDVVTTSLDADGSDLTRVTGVAAR